MASSQVKSVSFFQLGSPFVLYLVNERYLSAIEDKALAESGILGSNPSSATNLLAVLRQVTSSLCASISPSISECIRLD